MVQLATDLNECMPVCAPETLLGCAAAAGRGGMLTEQEMTFAERFLCDTSVSRLVAAMLFLQAKRLHTQRGGRAGAAAPRTRSSGRMRQPEPGTAGSSNAGGTNRDALVRTRLAVYCSSAQCADVLLTHCGSLSHSGCDCCLKQGHFAVTSLWAVLPQTLCGSACPALGPG